jgi:protein farnesyltransferase/geranylgeranyltransferase type-1 subunit alpha
VFESLFVLDRALQLTALCLQFNPANYTVWHFRRQCLQDGLTEDAVDQDLQLAARLGGSNPKNYQIWYHRCALLESFGLTPERARQELDYVATVLDEDAKNYHAWSHRQWVLRTVDNDDSWNKELEFGTTVMHVCYFFSKSLYCTPKLTLPQHSQFTS